MLTREQIDKFQRCAARLHEVDPWGPTMRTFATFGLVTVSREHGCMLTPAGHDLLATIPHLPAPEPEPSPAPCSRCGGAREVPLFMGPAMMECPECRVDTQPVKPIVFPLTEASLSGDSKTVTRRDAASPDGSAPEPPHFDFSAPGSESLERAAEHMRRLQEQWKAGTSVPRETIFDTSDQDSPPPGDGWVHITSSAVLAPFLGTRVEVHAPDCNGWPAALVHGRMAWLRWTKAGWLDFRDEKNAFICSVSAFGRGNVYLRPVSE